MNTDGTFLCIVEDTFDIKGRGLVIAPIFPVSTHHFEREMQVLVIRSDEKTILCHARFEVPFLSPPPKQIFYCCTLLGVTKENVPINSQLWIINTCEHQTINIDLNP